jgi:site-specific DNA recombinase
MKHNVSYSRYSSNNQSESSIEDQQRKCRQAAQKESREITREYADKAITGKSDSRPEYVRLIQDAKNGEIDTLYVDDLSRLSRSVTTAAIVDEFKYYGVRLVAISDGIDSNSKSSKIAVGMKSIMNNVFLDDLKDKVHRGLEGNALKGLNTGGRVYGYDPQAHFSQTKTDIYGRPEIEFVTRVINREQAAVVLQIFEWAAEGRSYNWIAHELNRRGEAAPNGGTWTASTIKCSVDQRPMGILNNRLYIGESIWNKTETIHNPLTGQERKRLRDTSEWIVKVREDLRIISDELWAKVKARQQIQKKSTEEKQQTSHPHARTGRTPKFLFSGILKCGECGANLIVVDQHNYRCGDAHRRGEAICQNMQKIPRTKVEEVLLASIKHELFRPEAVEEFRQEAARLLKQRKSELDPSIKAMMGELKQLSRDEDGLVNLLVEQPELSSIHAITNKLRAIQSRQSDLESRLETEKSMVADISPILPRALEIYREMIDHLPEALSRDIEPLRNQIIPLIGESIAMKPDEEGGWEATYRGSFRGLLRLGAPQAKISDEALRRGLFFLAPTR